MLYIGEMLDDSKGVQIFNHAFGFHTMDAYSGDDWKQTADELRKHIEADRQRREDERERNADGVALNARIVYDAGVRTDSISEHERYLQDVYAEHQGCCRQILRCCCCFGCTLRCCIQCLFAQTWHCVRCQFFLLRCLSVEVVFLAFGALIGWLVALGLTIILDAIFNAVIQDKADKKDLIWVNFVIFWVTWIAIGLFIGWATRRNVQACWDRRYQRPEGPYRNLRRPPTVSQTRSRSTSLMSVPRDIEAAGNSQDSNRLFSTAPPRVGA